MNDDISPDAKLLTRAEVARLFRVSPSTITRWADAGKLPTVKTLGGHRRYNAQSVLELARHFAPDWSKKTETQTRKEVIMNKTSINVPAMYGDHHVVEVREILLGLPGVSSVNASSCFHTVEVEFDPAQTSDAEMKMLLSETGYLDPLPVPTETEIAVNQRDVDGAQTFFRHTTAFEQTRQTVGFAQDVQYKGPPLWPCPGIGVVKGVTPGEETIHG